jgi:hypothetical protein
MLTIRGYCLGESINNGKRTQGVWDLVKQLSVFFPLSRRDLYLFIKIATVSFYPHWDISQCDTEFGENLWA